MKNPMRPGLLQRTGINIALAAAAFVSVAAAAKPAAVTHAASTDQIVSATYTRLHTFSTASDGLYPGPLAVGADGNLYGSASAGGGNGFGTVFRVTADGQFSILHAFTIDEGNGSSDPLVSGPDGSLYGLTSEYYDNGIVTSTGTVLFRISPAGAYSVVYRFANDGSQGSYAGTLAVAPNGVIYGSKAKGGANGSGIVFEIDALGNFVDLHDFSAVASDGTNADGSFPCGMAVAANGSVFGYTLDAGPNRLGVLYRIASDGSFSVTATPSTAPVSALLTGKDGNVYGDSRFSNGPKGTASGSVFAVNADGSLKTLYTAALGLGTTYVNNLIAGNDGNLYAVIGTTYDAIVRISPAGKHSVVHTFEKMVSYYQCGIGGCGVFSTGRNLDGLSSQLSQDSAGNLYGAANAGGIAAAGTLYRIAPDGSFTLLYSFDNGRPAGPLALTPSGRILGIDNAEIGGNTSVFTLSPAGALNVTASFSQATAKVGDQVTLTWSSTGATGCSLVSDISGASGALATSGSRIVVPSSNFTPFPLTVFLANGWEALVQCTAADGSEAGYPLQLPKY